MAQSPRDYRLGLIIVQRRFTIDTRAKQKVGGTNGTVRDLETRALGKYAAKRIKDGVSIEQIAAEVNASANKATESRSLARRKTEYSAKLMMVWAVYHVCDWPPLSRNRLKDKVGENVFTVDYVRAKYSDPGTLC